MLTQPAILDLVQSFPRRVSEALGVLDLPADILAAEEGATGDLLVTRIASVLLGMLTEDQMRVWCTMDRSTDDPTVALRYLLQTVEDADALITEEIELLFNELTTLQANV